MKTGGFKSTLVVYTPDGKITIKSDRIKTVEQWRALRGIWYFTKHEVLGRTDVTEVRINFDVAQAMEFFAVG